MATGCAVAVLAAFLAAASLPLSAASAADAGTAAGPVRASGALGGSSPAEVVYVANTDNGPVTVYKASSSGLVHPVRELKNPNLSAGYWQPWNVTLGPHGYVYVQTFLSEATTYVFKPGSSGPPARIFSVAGPDTQGVAVDAKGYTYVLGGEGPPYISVAAPSANGTAGGDYFVNPVRSFMTDSGGFNPWPSTLTAGPNGTVMAALPRPSGVNALEVYQGGPHGSANPIREISGPHTGLGSCAGFNSCDEVSVSYSSYTGRIYVGMSLAGGGARILVFAGNARGDARPVRVIAGSKTGLAGGTKAITGIADSQRTGDIYVMVTAAQFSGPGSVEVFPRYGNGNIRPLRHFTDAKTDFADAQGIAVGS